MRCGYTWRKYLKTGIDRLSRGIWPGPNSDDVPFSELEDERLGAILRRLLRECLDSHVPGAAAVYAALNGEADCRGLVWGDTIRVLRAMICDDNFHRRGALTVSITPFGIEANASTETLDGKLILDWSEIDSWRRQVDGVHQRTTPSESPKRVVDL